MTQQHPDNLIYEEVLYHIIGIKDGKLFSPEDFGIERQLRRTSTGCSRNYHSVYRCIDGRLNLDLLTVAANYRSKNISINTIRPISRETAWEMMTN